MYNDVYNNWFRVQRERERDRESEREREIYLTAMQSKSHEQTWEPSG